MEISVSRNSGTKSFVYSHKGCTLVIMPYLAGRKQAISVEASGRCIGSDAPFGSLNISYERQVDGAINEKVVQPDSPGDTSLSSSKESPGPPCGGTYMFAQLDTKLFDPVLGETVTRQKLIENSDNASWYDVTCDIAGRPAIFTRFAFGRKINITQLEYDSATNHVVHRIFKDANGVSLFTSRFTRDARGRPTKVENFGPDGKLQKSRRSPIATITWISRSRILKTVLRSEVAPNGSMKMEPFASLNRDILNTGMITFMTGKAVT